MLQQETVGAACFPFMLLINSLACACMRDKTDKKDFMLESWKAVGEVYHFSSLLFLLYLFVCVGSWVLLFISWTQILII